MECDKDIRSDFCDDSISPMVFSVRFNAKTIKAYGIMASGILFKFQTASLHQYAGGDVFPQREISREIDSINISCNGNQNEYNKPLFFEFCLIFVDNDYVYHTSLLSLCKIKYVSYKLTFCLLIV